MYGISNHIYGISNFINIWHIYGRSKGLSLSSFSINDTWNIHTGDYNGIINYKWKIHIWRCPEMVPPNHPSQGMDCHFSIEAYGDLSVPGFLIYYADLWRFFGPQF